MGAGKCHPCAHSVEICGDGRMYAAVPVYKNCNYCLSRIPVIRGDPHSNDCLVPHQPIGPFLFHDTNASNLRVWRRRNGFICASQARGFPDTSLYLVRCSSHNGQRTDFAACPERTQGRSDCSHHGYVLASRQGSACYIYSDCSIWSAPKRSSSAKDSNTK
jgi:hypothetical protein